jgi:endonuclease YncB( thermonuclease family)
VPDHCYYAKVVSIHDADTLNLDIFMEGKAGLLDQPIRLLDVYAVEKKDPGGVKATAQLQKLLKVGDLVVVRLDHVRMNEKKIYSNNEAPLGRLVGQVWRRKDGLDVNFALAKWLVINDLWGGTGTDPTPAPPAK